MRLRPNRLGDDDPDGDEYVILGGERLGASIVRRLRAAGHAARLVDEWQEAADVPGLAGDPSELRVLETAGLSTDSTVLVATPRDRRNLLVTGLVRSHFDVADCVVLVNTPDRFEAVSAADHEAVCVTGELSAVVSDRLTADAREGTSSV